ncbi:ribose 5-phosphate isomerase B [Cryomorpha ignava]|uniref:Ribose 5-phosphate isomerase B n=1 Tax=Cryomorpha ignava TaxID=101383 RepID=A0A7K3WM88_9FLAO|nr:ribose 5-phosphate isomerase B [Cryomorpha ignava]NEN22131.1 ribose 5-phosphate isomerase B [Cryomorpha ignava]
MKIAIGSDHAGYELKIQLVEYLNKKVSIYDKGTFSNDSTDYPEFAHAVANAIESGEVELGILICGSANGVAMTANKHDHVRCAICWEKEIAELARAHNDANIVALPARFISVQKAKDIVDAFLNTDFEGGRHQRRVSKIGIV